MRAQCPLDVARAADQIDAGIEMARSCHRSVNDDGRRVITTHSVDSDPDLQCPATSTLRRRL
jgi:hypothetical protein